MEPNNQSIDLTNIRIHLEMLKRMNKTQPSLCDKLINRLELSLTNVHTPASADFRQQQHNTYDDITIGAPMDLSWQIFDRSSLQQMMYTDWPAPSVVNEEPGLG